MTAIDLGASTGGFTDCLLQHGAAQVYAVDVGRGQLAWKLRQDPRVVVMEKTNARFLTRAAFPPSFAGAELIVADCSFISLQKILPPAVALLADSGKMLALVKPQFEAGKSGSRPRQGRHRRSGHSRPRLERTENIRHRENRPPLERRNSLAPARSGRQQGISGFA